MHLRRPLLVLVLVAAVGQVGLQHHLTRFQSQAETQALRAVRRCCEQLVELDELPLVPARIEAQVFVRGGGDEHAEVLGLQLRFLARLLQHYPEAARFLFGLAIASEHAEGQHGHRHHDADDDQHDQQLQQREAAVQLLPVKLSATVDNKRTTAERKAPDHNKADRNNE